MRLTSRRTVATAIVLFATIAGSLTAFATPQQQRRADPNSPRMKGVEALAAFLATEGDEAIADFMAGSIAAKVRDGMGGTALSSELAGIREELRGADRTILRPRGELSVSISYTLPGGAAAIVTITLDEDDPERFASIVSPEHDIGA